MGSPGAFDTTLYGWLERGPTLGSAVRYRCRICTSSATIGPTIIDASPAGPDAAWVPLRGLEAAVSRKSGLCSDSAAGSRGGTGIPSLTALLSLRAPEIDEGLKFSTLGLLHGRERSGSEVG